MDFSPRKMIMGPELIPFFRERLAAGQSVRYLPFRGVSMLPLLRQGKDEVELSPLPSRLRKYDLPVYQYPSGKVVMHRVVAVEEGYYVCLGDNTYEPEHIPHEWMIALVSAFKRGDRRVSADSASYRLYSRIWVALFPLRRLLCRTVRFLKKTIKKILHWN